MDTFADWQVPTWVMVLVVGVLTISLVIGVPLARMAGSRRGRRLAHPELLTTKRQKAADTALFLAALVPSVLVWLAVMGVSFIGLTGFAARVMNWTHWTNMLVPLSLDGISVSFGAWAFVAVKRGRHPGRAYKIVLAAATMSAILNFVHGHEEWSLWAGIYLAFLSFTGMAMFHELLEQFMAAYDEETALRSRYPRFGQRWLYAPISTFAARRAWIVNPPREPLRPSIRNALEHLEYVREERRLYRLGGATRVREEQQARLVEIQARMEVKAAKRGDATASPDSLDVLERLRKEPSPSPIPPITATGSAATGSAATGSAATGSAATGSAATGSAATASAGAQRGEAAVAVSALPVADHPALPAAELPAVVDAVSAPEQTAAPARRRRGKEVTVADAGGATPPPASAEPTPPPAAAKPRSVAAELVSPTAAGLSAAELALPAAEVVAPLAAPEPVKPRRRGAKAGGEDPGEAASTATPGAPAEAPPAERAKRRTKATAARTDLASAESDHAADAAGAGRADGVGDDGVAFGAQVMTGEAQPAEDPVDGGNERWRLEVPKSGWQRIGEAADSAPAASGSDGAAVPLFGAAISRPVLPERVPQILDAHVRPGDDLSVGRLTNLVLRSLAVPANRDAVSGLVRTWVGQIERGTRGYLDGPRPTPEAARPFGQKLEYPFEVLTLQKVVINHRAVVCPDCGTEESLMFSGQHKRRPVFASCGCGQRWPIVGLGSERVGEVLANEVALGQAELLGT